MISKWIAGLARTTRPPTAPAREGGMLVTPAHYSPELDAIGELPAVSCWRLRKEDCRHYQHRLAIHLQEQINQREDFKALLDRVLAVKVR